MKAVKGYIERKTMLYKTGVEYGDYTMNHVLGCAHGCKYPCYAFLMARRFGKVQSYKCWIEPYLVRNTLEILDWEIPRLKSKIESVHLCFTTDPFMYEYDEIEQMSLAAIRKLNEAGIKCTVLTKGLLPEALADLSDENEYGITLISLDEGFRNRIEPGAASYQKRLATLRNLHDRGCKTWVSIEPYPTPNLIEQDLGEILYALKFTDKIIFGRTNYNKDVGSYVRHKEFFHEQALKVINFCTENGMQCHIKDGTMFDVEQDSQIYPLRKNRGGY
ncbi:MAG: radical SAM protein [Elusimicrobiota bacterium]|jgi:DNA repair photolyase|nr:radical SAM protein [Elusimicrobiota bacterium]